MFGERLISMKTFIFALIGLLGVTLGAPLVEAGDKHDKHHKHHHHRDYSRYDRYHDHHRHYSRDYYYRSPRYYSYPRSYGYYDYGYSRRPGLTFYFGR